MISAPAVSAESFGRIQAIFPFSIARLMPVRSVADVPSARAASWRTMRGTAAMLAAGDVGVLGRRETCAAIEDAHDTGFGADRVEDAEAVREQRVGIRELELRRVAIATVHPVDEADLE